MIMKSFYPRSKPVAEDEHCHNHQEHCCDHLSRCQISQNHVQNHKNQMSKMIISLRCQIWSYMHINMKMIMRVIWSDGEVAKSLIVHIHKYENWLYAHKYENDYGSYLEWWRSHQVSSLLRVEAAQTAGPGPGYDDSDDNNDDNGDDGCDIYIMMKCVCVCHEKSSLPLQVCK